MRKAASPSPERLSLQQILSLDPIHRFSALYTGGKTYEVTLPMSLNSKPVGRIRLGISTSLLRRELNASLKQNLALAGLALPVAWLVAMALASLILKPIRKLAREVGRFRRGEFEAGTDLVREDELGELTSQLQLLGQELESDRLKMRSEKAQLQQVVDHLEDGIIFFNQDRKILFFNKAAEVVMGRPPEQTVGCQLADTLEPSPPLRPLLEQAFEQKTGFRNATSALPGDGRTKEFLVSVFFMTDVEKAMGAMALLKDLESVKTLRSLINYSAKLTALGRLTSGVAHEVKNPLNAMMIHLELLKEKLEVSSEDVQQSLEGSRFALQLDPALPPIIADEELLHQAFLNILLNACQAMPAGGAVSIATERETRESVKVSIADEGVGIPPEELDKIFQLYYTTKPNGSGIGLSLVYRIVQMHDGVIDVLSEVGWGTTMIVRLPVS